MRSLKDTLRLLRESPGSLEGVELALGDVGLRLAFLECDPWEETLSFEREKNVFFNRKK